MKEIEKEVKNNGFSKYFPCIVGSVHDKTKTILQLLKENQFEPNETAYIGDMCHDIEAGKKANIKTIGVTWGYEPKEKLETADPDYIIATFEQLKALLK